MGDKPVFFVSERLKVRSGMETCCPAMFARQKWPSVECRDGFQGGDLHFRLPLHHPLSAFPQQASPAIAQLAEEEGS